MLINFDPEKYYIIEKVGSQRNSSKLVTADAYEHAILDIDKVDNYIKHSLANELLVEYEGGVKDGTLYLLMYDKIKTNDPIPGSYRYELRIVPVDRVNPRDLI